MRALAWSIFAFGVSGFIGPFIRWITWPPTSPTGAGREDFIYNVVLLLWPTQPLAVVEATTGRLVAAAIAVGANVLLFVALGVAAGLAGRRPALVGALYLGSCSMTLLFSLWLSGFERTALNLMACIVAFVLYAAPFAITFRMFSTDKTQRA